MQKNTHKKCADTHLLGIIGDPIEHTLSPLMHNKALEKLSLPFTYLPFHVKPRQLKMFLTLAKKSGIKGFNVTIPHKETILRHIKSLSKEAKLIGAVNTVSLKNGKWFGDNTDGAGYLKSLQEEMKFNPAKKNIVVLGAGGAARAVLCSLAQKKPTAITILNRTLKNAQKLAQEFSKKFPKTHFSAFSLERDSCRLVFPDTDLLVNSTSIGLHGTTFSDLDLKALPKKAIVSDLIYRPLHTPLLKSAKKHGLKIHTGIGMLLHQGGLSFGIWTRKKAPTSLMKKALLDALS